MGKIWLDHLCQIDHMWPDDVSENEPKNIEKDRKIGKVAPRKRKSDANLTQGRFFFDLNYRFDF